MSIDMLRRLANRRFIIIIISPHLKRIATLPCEISVLENSVHYAAADLI